MAEKDILAKEVFTSETPWATQGRLRFRRPPKVSYREVEPDGLLCLKAKKGLKQLTYPWRLFPAGQSEVVLELKMKGDHSDKKALKRAFLQRQAREFFRYRKFRYRGDTPLWFVSATLPPWLRAYATVHQVAKGCYQIESSFFPFYWIASNELPLVETSIPFLITRTGKPLKEFATWVSLLRDLDWLTIFLDVVKMEKAFSMHLLKNLPPTTDKARLARRKAMAETLAESIPGVKDKYVREGELKGAVSLLAQLAAPKLGRVLTIDENAQLLAALSAKGTQAVLDAVRDKTKDELLLWLKGFAKKKKAAGSKKTTARK